VAGARCAGRVVRVALCLDKGGGASLWTTPGVNSLHAVSQSMTPWSPNSGGLGPPTTQTTSPTRLNAKNFNASVGLRLMQPWETFGCPGEDTDHGGACTYSPLSLMCTSEYTSSS